jgi:hypothetical protein
VIASGGGNGGTGGSGITFENGAQNQVSVTAAGNIGAGNGGTGVGNGGNGGNGISGGDVAIVNNGIVQGGIGGGTLNGSVNNVGGNGGAGLSLVSPSSATVGNQVLNNGRIYGGTGGEATQSDFSESWGGNGGAGIKAVGTTITNASGALIEGGQGGNGPNLGSGGAAIQGGYLTIQNYGTLTGGDDGSGNSNQAPAVNFTSGVNVYAFSPAAVTKGQVVAYSLSDTVQLTANPNGGGNGSFNQQNVGSANQGTPFEGFGNYQVTGGHWTVLNSVADVDALANDHWTVSGGTLQMGTDNGDAAEFTSLTVTGLGVVTGMGSVDNNLYNVNGGTVSPGWGNGKFGTISVYGNYDQDATSKLLVEVAPNGSGSELYVNGTANLAGTLQVVLDPGKYTASSFKVLGAGSITGGFATLSFTTASGVGAGSGSIASHDTEIDVVGVDGTVGGTLPGGGSGSSGFTVAPEDDAIFGYLGTEALASGIRTERGLQRRLAGLRRDSGGSADVEDDQESAPKTSAKTAPSSDDEDAPVASKAPASASDDDDVAPVAHAPRKSAAADEDDLTKGSVAPFGEELSPLNNLLTLLPNGEKREGLWLKASLASNSVSGASGEPGLTGANGGAVLAGFDHRFGDSLVLGAALGYDHVSLTLDDAETGTLNVPSLSVYGGWALGPVNVDADLGYAAVSASSTRPFTLLLDSATSSHNGSEIDAAVQAALPLTFGFGTFEPAAGFRYVGLSEASVSESGAGAQDLNVAAASTDALQPYAQVTWAKGFRLKAVTLAPEAEFGLADETSTSAGNRSVSVGGGSFTVPGSYTGGVLVDLGAGVAARWGSRFAVAADGLLVEGGGASDKEFSLGGRYRF